MGAVPPGMRVPRFPSKRSPHVLPLNGPGGTGECCVQLSVGFSRDMMSCGLSCGYSTEARLSCQQRGRVVVLSGWLVWVGHSGAHSALQSRGRSRGAADTQVPKH